MIEETELPTNRKLHSFGELVPWDPWEMLHVQEPPQISVTFRMSSSLADLLLGSAADEEAVTCLGSCYSSPSPCCPDLRSESV